MNLMVSKMHPCLIDLPDSLFTKDLLIINAHMSCCDNDNDRQEQAMILSILF